MLFIKTAAELEVQRQSLVRKAESLRYENDSQRDTMVSAINTTFRTLRGNMESLERNVLETVAKGAADR